MAFAFQTESQIAKDTLMTRTNNFEASQSQQQHSIDVPISYL